MADDDWSEEDIQQLILEYKCRPILWNVALADTTDRREKTKAWKSLAEIFNTTVSNTQRKIQHLRNQFEVELKKNSRKKTGKKRKSISTAVWPHFESLQFINAPDTQTGVSHLSRTPSPIVEEYTRATPSKLDTEDNTEDSTEDTTNVEIRCEIQTRHSPETTRPLKRRKLNEFTPKRGVSWEPTRPLARDWLSEYRSESTTRAEVVEDRAESVCIESSVSSHNMDEYDVFSKFVASEIRNLKQEESKKRLKCMIQKCILQVSEEDSKKSLYPSLLGFQAQAGLSPLRRTINSFSPESERFKFSRFRSNMNFD